VFDRKAFVAGVEGLRRSYQQLTSSSHSDRFTEQADRAFSRIEEIAKRMMASPTTKHVQG
jgi:hypothetical protein